MVHIFDTSAKVIKIRWKIRDVEYYSYICDALKIRVIKIGETGHEPLFKT
jgi:hypothetical protein